MSIREQIRVVAQWIGLGSLVGVAGGLASAAFLAWLDRATALRTAHPALVYALPVAGLLLGFAYERWGAPIRGGSNLVLESVHDGSPRIPLRLAPMALVGTVLTHLFGGSAGREGTAVQMGASLADEVAHRFRVAPDVRRQLLAAGIAGGFGSVFGTPVAGAVFGLEVVLVGRLEYDALLPALVAAVVGDLVTRGVGIEHTSYPVPAALPLTPVLLLKWLVFAVAIAAAAFAFIELTHRLKDLLERHLPRLPLRMMAGGFAILGLWWLAGTHRYLGLGIPTILESFTDPGPPASAFAAKLLFTAVTLSAGFLGGEVTPLFFVGATLGNTLGHLLGLPPDLAAAVGLAAVFGAAANTPLALTIMAVELLGASVLPHVAIVTVLAFLLSGHRGIYPSQRIGRWKLGGALMRKVVALRELGARSTRPPEPNVRAGRSRPGGPTDVSETGLEDS
jgi:H+/Cl- antiporter ClcA